MRILFTGGGTGGHFYPVIAIAEELGHKLKEREGFASEMYYVADEPFDERLLYEYELRFKRLNTGKIRRYFSFKNFTDIFRTIAAVFKALVLMYRVYPDVVVGKGGYASFPVLLAARFFLIPVIIHESDSVPGVVNKWAGKFAEKVAVSYPGAEEYFPKEKTAVTGNPIRRSIRTPVREGAHEMFSLEEGVPVILVLGGSQGAQLINRTILEAIARLIPYYQVLHQVGTRNVDEVRNTAQALLAENEYADRYHVFDYLDDRSLRMAAGVTDIVVSRAGSTIFEIAAWGIPSILIPIERSNGDHQRKNAYTYARFGACDVIEENNFNPNLLVHEIDRLMEDEGRMQEMRSGAQEFARTDAAEKIADQIIGIFEEHQG